MQFRKLSLPALILALAAVSGVETEALSAQLGEEVPVCNATSSGILCYTFPDPTQCVVIDGTAYCQMVNWYAEIWQL